MTEEMLRRWASGELDPTERRAVTRWVVRCTDPDLPVVLHGMLRESRESTADAALRQVDALWGRLVDAWGALLDAGQAEWTVPEGGLVLASVGGPWVRIDDGPTVVVEPTDDEVVLYLTDDRPMVQRLHGPGAAPTGQIALPTPDGRTTLWAIRGAGLPRRPDAREELLAALDVGTVVALRWDGR